MHTDNTPIAPVALITGTSSGIGLTTAVTLATSGWRVIATMRDTAKAQALQTAADAAKITLDIRALDVTNDESVKTCVDAVMRDYGRLDALVNNAGAGFRGTIEQITMTQLQDVMDVNFYGVVRMTQAVLPHFRQAMSGRIVTVSSLGGVVALPFSDAYCAAKFAVEGLMESLASTASAFGIHISLIEPGAVRTGFLGNMSTANASGADDPYAELAHTYGEVVKQRFSSLGEDGEQVAAVIQEALTSPAPHVRYQSSTGARSVAAQKLVDPTGDSIRAAGRAMLGLAAIPA